MDAISYNTISGFALQRELTLIPRNKPCLYLCPFSHLSADTWISFPQSVSWKGFSAWLSLYWLWLYVAIVLSAEGATTEYLLSNDTTSSFFGSLEISTRDGFCTLSMIMSSAAYRLDTPRRKRSWKLAISPPKCNMLLPVSNIGAGPIASSVLLLLRNP